MLLLAIPVALSIAGCGNGKKPGSSCDFDTKWPAGRQCAYKVEVREQTFSVTPGADRQPQAAGGRGGARLRTDRVAATSVLEVVWQTAEVNLSVGDEPQGGARKADLVVVSAAVEREQRAKAGPGRIMRRKLSGATGARVEYALDESGRIEKADGVMEFMRQVIRDGPLANETFAAVFNEDFMKQMRITGWKYLPDGPAAPGYEWVSSDRIEFQGIGRLLVSRRHRFEKWEKRGDSMCARISWWSCIGNVVGTTAADDAMPDTVKKVESVGWCLFSPRLGMVVEWCEDLSVVTALEVPDRNLARGDVTQEIRRRMTVNLAGPVRDSMEGSGRFLGDKKVSVARKPRKPEEKNEKGGLRVPGKAAEATGGGR